MLESSTPPPAPTAPDPADCCGQGCSTCIYDRYDAAMQAWRVNLAAWELRRPPARGPATPKRDGRRRS